MKTLRDFPVGKKVLIYLVTDPNGARYMSANNIGGSRKVPTTILYKDNFAAVTLGWFNGEEYPTIMTQPNAPNYLVQGVAGVVRYGVFGDHVECEELEEGSITIQAQPHTAKLVDSPCRQCKRPNNITDKNCWWCSVPEPVGKGMVCDRCKQTNETVREIAVGFGHSTKVCRKCVRP